MEIIDTIISIGNKVLQFIFSIEILATILVIFGIYFLIRKVLL